MSVLALGPLRAVAIAFLLSTIDVIRRASCPETSALREAADGSHFAPAGAGDEVSPSGLVVYRFGAPLYFANATLFAALEGDAITNLEASLGLRQSHFTYDFTRISMTVAADLFPSLSQWGRVRVELNSSIKREIVRDFTLGFTIYDSYDSKPPTADAKKNDVGLSLTIGWVF